ncbi:MAG: endonuclease/exonuclease/phosphatase family protein [Spirochaetales bacterium]|nr:endonuclease/exonuclease/phosphatase family protein [Spirochaetales bacterium]
MAKRIVLFGLMAALIALFFSCSSPVAPADPGASPSTEASTPEGGTPPSSEEGEPLEGTIRVATFNIQIFGPTKISRPNVLDTLAHIATRYDVIAIQEVGSNGTPTEETATLVMDSYIAKVNETAGAGLYAYVRGHQYAIVYRTDRLAVEESRLYTGTQTFTYQPLVANMRMIEGNFDFSILTVHTSPDLAGSEIPALKVAMQELVTQYDEPDVICLGDFNADGSYYDEGTEDFLAGWEGYFTGVPNDADTTVATSSNTYDRIQMSSSLQSDFVGNWDVLRFSDYYDVSVLEGATTTAGTESALSDHYPVWCEFHIDRDDN